MRMAHLLFAGAALSAPMFFTQSAHAVNLDACGGIFFEGEGSISCTVEAKGGCTAKCEPIAFTASCSAELQVGCSGECNLEADVECTGSCGVSCEADCEASAEFDCQGYCEADCGGSCAGECEAAGNKAECQASCEANCSAECTGGCEGQAQADCSAQCEGCCGGSCTAEANASCQVECQAEGYVDCKAELQGGCEAQCEAPEGAIFCDGQFISTDNVEACVAALEDLFQIEVQYNFEAECDGNECSANAEVSASACSASPDSTGSMFGGFALAIVGAGLGLAGRRRRRS
jgi:hypothetical protein